MQIALHTQSTVDAYIAGQQWREASLAYCPLHPPGVCTLVRHGSYARTKPLGLRVARWYCPQGHCTFSLLPDFLAARLPGLLADVETAVVAARHGSSIESVAANLREAELTLPSAVRWLQRRLRPVRAAIDTLVARGSASITDALSGNGFLERLRCDLDAQTLEDLPPPLGWRRKRLNDDAIGCQHEKGADDQHAEVYRDPITSAPSTWPPHRSVRTHHAYPPRRRSFGSGAPTVALPSEVPSTTCSGSVGSVGTLQNVVSTNASN